MGSVLYEKDPTEISLPFCHVRTQREGAICEPGGGTSPEHGHAGALILDFPGSRTEKEISVV